MVFDEMVLLEKDEQKKSEYYSLNSLFGEDIVVCNYVASQLSNINIGTINRGKEISLEELVSTSLDEIKIFGADIYTMASNLVRTVPINVTTDCDFSQFATCVVYSVLQFPGFNRRYLIKDSAKISSYKVPDSLFELSGYVFSHEHIHALKDTNYDEYVDCKTLGETIPLFYELLMYDPNDVLKRELIKLRMIGIVQNIDEYLMINAFSDIGKNIDFININCVGNRIQMFSYLRSKIGVYLNSFYYAIILYNMYKENPVKILELVSKILRHEMTTYELLNKLGIYGDIRGYVFEKEIDNIKKRLR